MEKRTFLKGLLACFGLGIMGKGLLGKFRERQSLESIIKLEKPSGIVAWKATEKKDCHLCGCKRSV